MQTEIKTDKIKEHLVNCLVCRSGLWNPCQRRRELFDEETEFKPIKREEAKDDGV